MSEIKRRTATWLFLPLLLVLILKPAFAEDTPSGDLLSEDAQSADTVHYREYTAESGTYTETVSLTATLDMPKVVSVVNENDAAVFVRTYFRPGMPVNEGDILMDIRVNYDPVSDQEAYLALELAEENYAGERLEKEEEIRKYRYDSRNASGYDRTLADLHIAVLERELAYFDETETRRIETLRASYEESLAEHAVTTITAPCSGMIKAINYTREGMAIDPGAVVAEIADSSVVMIRAKGSGLRYGMAVTVESGVAPNRIELPGHVAAACDLVPAASSEFVYITLDDPSRYGDLSQRGLSVKGCSVLAGNAVTVRKSAVTLEGGLYYVMKLMPDGSTGKRYVVPAKTGAETYWILRGLTDGDTVVTS